jgi:hypothetical protein
VAEMAVLGVFFEHLYTAVNRVGKRDQCISDLSSAIHPSSLTSAPSASGLMTPDMARHPRFTDSFLSPVSLYTMKSAPVPVRSRGID